MTIRKILVYPEYKQELRQKSEVVQQINPKVKMLIRDLKDTLRSSDDGIGLAAPQINFHQQVVIVCLGTEVEGKWEAGPPRALINPSILLAEDDRKDYDGCLSFPGLYGETIRPHRLRVTGQNEDGHPFDELFEGFNAVVVHHEIDHLQGILFIDRAKSVDDLYTLEKNEYGAWVRRPVDAGF